MTAQETGDTEWTQRETLLLVWDVTLGIVLAGIGGAIIGTIAGSATGVIGSMFGGLTGMLVGGIGAGLSVAITHHFRRYKAA